MVDFVGHMPDTMMTGCYQSIRYCQNVFNDKREMARSLLQIFMFIYMYKVEFERDHLQENSAIFIGSMFKRNSVCNFV